MVSASCFNDAISENLNIEYAEQYAETNRSD